MKALSKQDEGQVGIGTMIVFIATVLVAAVAAGVLIDMSGKLQERSSRTGSEATSQVSSNLEVSKILGKRDNATASGLQDMEVYISLAPGAQEVDISLLKLQMLNATNATILDYTSGTASAGEFTAQSIRDVDQSFSAAIPVMTSGDLVRIDVELDTNSLEFQPRSDVRLVLLPEVGNQVALGFLTPNSYGTRTVVELA